MSTSYVIVDNLPAQTGDIKAAERMVGEVIPDNLQKFLMSASGGYLVPGDFVYLEPDGAQGASTVQMIATVSGGRKNLSSLANLLSVYQGRIPRGTIPFAEDCGGNQILMYLSGERQGQVWYWDHEQEDGTGSEVNVYWIADSLEDFLNGLDEINE